MAELLFAAVIGLLAYAVSWLVLPQHLETTAFGTEWQRMSAQPFAFLDPAAATAPLPENWFPHRCLGPLLAHLLGLGGANWVHFTQLTAVLLLVVTCVFARARGASRLDAAIVAFAVALTGAVQVYKVDMVGYVDDLGYSIALLAWLSARRASWFWLLVFCGLLNHEMSAFFLPWLWFVRREAGASIRTDLVALPLVLLVYAGFRAFVAAHVAPLYDAGYFLKHTFLPLTFLWLWLQAGVHLLLTFGPLLAVVLWHCMSSQHGRERRHALLVVGGFLGVFLFAYDVNRHSNTIVLPLVLASIRCLGDRRRRAVYLALLVASVGIVHQFHWVYDWLNQLMVIELPGHELILPEHRFDLGLHWQILVGTVVRAWPVLLGLLGEAVLIVAIARWLRRRGAAALNVATAVRAIGACRPAFAVPMRRRRTLDPRAGT